MAINFYFDPAADRERKRRQEQNAAVDRLKALFGTEDVFGFQPMPTAQDLLTYQTATGGQTWPKERLSDDEIRTMQQGVTDDTLGMAVNVPTEVVAQPMTRSELIERKSQEDALGEITKDRSLSEYQPEQWRRDWDQLGQFSEEKDFDLSGEDMLANLGIKRAPTETTPETWLPGSEGPGGSRIQTSSRGKEYAVLGRKPTETEGKVPEYVKEAQDFIMKYTRIDPMTALAAAFDSDLKEKLKAEVPATVRPIFDNALAILKNYYMTQAQNIGVTTDPLGIRQ